LKNQLRNQHQLKLNLKMMRIHGKKNILVIINTIIFSMWFYENHY